MARNKSLSQSDEPTETVLASLKRKTLLMKQKVSFSRAASRSGSTTSITPAVSQDGPPSDSPHLHGRIADRAHELYTHRGGHHGLDLEDWFEAERQVLEEGC